jgi:hypothetical protein
MKKCPEEFVAELTNGSLADLVREIEAELQEKERLLWAPICYQNREQKKR